MSECIQLYNLLLVRLNVTITLKNLKDVNSELLIALYRSVSADSEPSIAGDHIKALSYVIKSLETLLGTDLDHISVEELINKDEKTLYNIAEIYIGLLDLIEESNARSDDTTDLCKVSVNGELPIFNLDSLSPFSPIPDATQSEFCTKFPAVVNSSYSGSEPDHGIEWVPCSSENRDSSRSEGKQSLFTKIETRIQETSNVKPIIVSTRLSSTDLEWTSNDPVSARTSDLVYISHSDLCSNNLINKAGYQLDSLDLSAIEKSAHMYDNDKTLVDESTVITESLPIDQTVTEEIIAKLDAIEKDMAHGDVSNKNPVQNNRAGENVSETDHSCIPSANSNNSNNSKLENIGNTLSGQTSKSTGSSSYISNSSKECMKHLVQALQQTVEDSRRVRAEFQKEKTIYGLKAEKCKAKSEKAIKSEAELLTKEKKIPTVDSKNEFDPKKEMKKLMEKENILRRGKQALIEDEYQAQIKDAKQLQNKLAEQQGMNEFSNTKEESFRPVLRHNNGKTKSITKAKRNPLPTSYKVVQKNNLDIGEGDVLKTVMEEIPGLDYDHQTMKLLNEKQESQMILLDKEAREYTKKVRQKDKRVAEVRQRQRMMANIVEKEEMVASRIKNIKEKQSQERGLAKDMQARRRKNAKIKKYFAEYETGLRNSLTKKKYKEEQMLKRIFEEGLAIQKDRLREVRTYAQEMREAENKKRDAELASIENFYKDKFDILAEDMKIQKSKIKESERENARKLTSAKTELSKKLENEIREMQQCIVRENESIFYRDLEEERLMKQLKMAKFRSRVNNAKR